MKTFLTVVLLLISMNMSAQFDVNSGEKIEETITIEGTAHDIYVTSSNSAYIICNSPRTKNNYAVWIGEPAQLDGQEVRVSRSGKHFIFVVSKKTNNPYCKYLKRKQDGITGKRIVTKTKKV